MARDDGSTLGQTNFGDVLRRHRRAAGLSQEGLAEITGLSRRGVADLERGARRFPYPDTVRRLADALKLGPSERAAFVDAGGPRRDAGGGRYVLSMPPTPIVGRGRELAALQQLAAGSRLLTLTGGGGIGKTRLALELSHRIESQFEHGAVMVDMSPVGDVTGVPAAVASGLRIRCGPGSVSDTVRRHLAPMNVLVVLDNCEHVVRACAVLADALLRDCAHLSLVVTSREPLRIPGERVWLVPPMADDESVDLFVQRATSAGATIVRTAGELDWAPRITARLEGIPLAIELAAARVPALGLGQVSRHLTDRLEFLSRGGRLDAPRHQTLRAALDWSYDLFDPPVQALFARLAVFSGGWAVEAAQEVCQGGGSSAFAVMEGLGELVEKSLVLAEDDDEGERRFRLLDTVREYALERFALSPDPTSVVARHARYFRQVAEEAAVTRLGLFYPGNMAQVGLEHANMTAALTGLLAAGEVEEGVRVCQALGGFWLAQGFLREGQDWLERFVTHPRAVPSVAVAGGLLTWGRLAQYSGEFSRARDLFRRSLSLGEAHTDPIVSARALCGLGDVDLHLGRPDTAHHHVMKALNLTQGDGSAIPERAQALLCLGRVDGERGELEQSIAWLEQALALERQLGDDWGVAYALNELGLQARRAGQLGRAESLFEECHVLWHRSGTLMGERAAAMNLSLVALALGETTRAAHLALRSLDLVEIIDDDGSATTVRCVEIAALVLEAVGSTDTAVGLIAAATRRRELLAAPRPRVEESELTPVIDHATTQLGATAFAAAWKNGWDLSMPEALHLAADRLIA